MIDVFRPFITLTITTSGQTSCDFAARLHQYLNTRSKKVLRRKFARGDAPP